MMQSVQVIIERLKTHPEDFFGDLNDGRPQHVRFGELASKLDDLLTVKRDGEIHRLWYLNEDEKAALLEAYREARRARFEAKTFHQLLTKPEESRYDLNVATRKHPTTGKFMMQGTGSVNSGLGGSALWQSAVPKEEEEGAKIVDHINKAFEEEYAKTRNPRP
jgi:hypothetical protein